jgi:serine/threonine-protein kinase
LEHELERALSKNAADRHPSAEAFADALAATVEIPPDDLEATAPQPHGTADVPVLIQETGEHKNFQPELDPTVLVPRPPTELLPPRPRTRVAWMQPATWKRLGTRPGPLIALLAILVLLVMRGQAGAIVRVPALTGRSLAGATELARQSGFGVRPTEVAGGGKPGTVVGQDPAPGRLLARGSSIELRVTRGARQVVVPDVSGKPIEEAIRALGEAKLSAGADVSYVTSQTVKPGNVVRTVPPAGAGVDEGSTVQIIASALPLPADEDGSGKGHGKGKGRD